MNRKNLMALTLLMAALLGAGCNSNQPLPAASENQVPQNADTEQVVTQPATNTSDIATSTRQATTSPTQKPTQAASGATLPKGPITVYVGTGCPHCEKVEARAQETGMDKKLPIVFKEVFNDMNNAEEFMDVAKKCGLDLNNLGVPVMWDGQTCTLGDPDIIKFIDLTNQAYAKQK